MTPEERTAKQLLRKAIRSTRAAESRFTKRDDAGQQQAWAAETRRIWAMADGADEAVAGVDSPYARMLREAASHIGLALVAVANIVHFRSDRRQYEFHADAARRLIRGKEPRQ